MEFESSSYPVTRRRRNVRERHDGNSQELYGVIREIRWLSGLRIKQIFLEPTSRFHQHRLSNGASSKRKQDVNIPVSSP